MNWLTNLFTKKSNINSAVNLGDHKPELGETGESVYIKDDRSGILNMAGNLFGGKPEEYIYISIGSVSVKILSTTKLVNGKCKLLWLEEIFLGPIDGKYKGETVDNIYKVLPIALDKVKDKILEQKNVFVSLPAQGVFFKNINIPKIENSDKLLEAEIKKVIPIPFEDVLFANNLIWLKDNTEYHFCVVMQKEFISRFEEIFSGYSVKPYFEIEPFSLSRVIFKNDQIRCVVNIGAEHTLLTFIQNSSVIGVNIIENGSVNINIDMKLKTEISFEQAEELKINFQALSLKKMDSAGVVQDFLLDFSKKISKDISTSILQFEREQNVSVSEIAVCGGGAVIPNIKENILVEFENGIRVKKLNSQNLIEDDAKNLHEENIARFAQCIGLLLLQL